MSTRKWVAVAGTVAALLTTSTSLAIGQGQPDSAATVTGLSPASMNQSTTALGVSVRGTGFSNKSKVRVDGTPRSTTFVSETELRATLSAADVASAGSRSVSVFNPGGGSSNEVRLAITAAIIVPPAPPPPSDIVAPLFQPALLADLRLTATSASGAVATLAAPHAVDNSGNVTVTATPYAIGVPVTFPVGTNTANYRATDPSGNFATISQRIIVAPLPVAPTAPAPAPAPPSADTSPPSFFAVRLADIHTTATLISGAVVTLAMPQASDNSGSVTVTASIGNILVDRPFQFPIGTTLVMFTATDPSGNKSTLSQSVIVDPQPPPMSIALLSPASALPGAGEFPMRVTGSGFKSGMVVRWNGSTVSTQFVSSSVLITRIPSGRVASFGVAKVTIYDPTTRIETPAMNFRVDAAAGAVPRITDITPTRGIAGAAVSVRVSGTGLVPGSMLRWRADGFWSSLGSVDTVATFDTGGNLVGGIPGRLATHAAPYTVKVYNPGQSGGESNGVAFLLNNGAQTPTRLARESNDSQKAAPGATITYAPAVSVRDQEDKPIAGIPVGFNVSSGGGVITPASVVTDANGVARTTSWRLGSSLGQNAVVASSAGVLSLTFTATSEAPVPVVQSFQAATPTSLVGSTGAAVSQPPAVMVKDQRGSPFAGANVSFLVIAGGGTVSPAVQTTGADGIARLTTWTLGPNVGVNQVKASIASTGFATTFTAKVPYPIVAFVKRADGTQIASAQVCVGSRNVIDQYSTVKDAGTFGRQTFSVEAVAEYGVTASKGGFAGRTVFFTPTSNSGSVTVTLTPGSGGPTCPGAVTSVDATTSIALPVSIVDHRVTVASYSVPSSGISTGNVVLTRPAPVTVPIALASSNAGVATVPSSISVMMNSDRATFAIAPRGPGCAKITGTQGGNARSTYIVVHPTSSATSLTLTVPNAILPIGANAPASLTLVNTFTTPLGGVALSSSNTSVATVPASPALTRGSASFTIATKSPGCTTITAKVGTQTISRTIQVVDIGS